MAGLRRGLTGLVEAMAGRAVGVVGRGDLGRGLAVAGAALGQVRDQDVAGLVGGLGAVAVGAFEPALLGLARAAVLGHAVVESAAREIPGGQADGRQLHCVAGPGDRVAVVAGAAARDGGAVGAGPAGGERAGAG